MRPLLNLTPKRDINFLRGRRIAVAFSVVMIVASILLIAFKGLNLGVDFVGGQLFRVTLSQPAELDDLRGRIGALGYGDATIQQFGGPNEIAIRMSLPEGGDGTAAEATNRVRDTIAAASPGARFDAVETVSGQVSQELAEAGALSLFLAMIAISIYIWFRFEWQFGVGALISLAHDLTITVGFFALTQIEFGLNVVAALLTVIGYSLNDTVVVYDRVRENLRKYRKMDIESLLNLSVNETLSRTIATNSAVGLAVLALVLIGPSTIFGLTIGILFGVLIGTFSSIYVARFLLVPLGVGPDSFVPKSGGHEGAERIGRTTPLDE